MPDMVEYFRRRAVAATVALIAIGSIALAAVGIESPHLLTAMFTGLGAPFAIATVVLTPVVGFLHLRGIFQWFRLLSIVVVGSLVFAWGLAQSPYLLPGQLTIAQAGAPLGTEVLLLLVTLFVVLVVLPSLALLVYFDQRGALESPEA
jgi:cytochrome d ubiquinol oxidase subunit II